ncbi:MAG: class I SAM-dependent RNA methyltransferase [Clostridia bacterium]|nr:class I SAM-dependent RNA methyltransferase [Clostridia bacterium]
MQKFLLTVPTMLGTESVTANEIRRCGYETAAVENGRVTFEGDCEAVAVANVRLRAGERVLINLGSFRADTFDALFEGTRALGWEEFIPLGGAFPVKGHALSSKLHSVPDCQAIIKKAVARRLGACYGMNVLPEDSALYQIQFSIMRDVATLYIDTTGISLHKRGYRPASVAAPLRETLAFSMIDIARWGRKKALLDPFCGSGTIAIEAALFAANIAPGVNRTFAAENWKNMDKKHFANAREETRDEEERGDVRIYASDIDKGAVKTAQENARRAGVDGMIRFSVRDMRDLEPLSGQGAIICNPPYGERLMDKRSCEALYADMGKKFGEYEGFTKHILTSHEGFEKFYARTADKRRKLYNGTLKCNLYQYYKL